MYTYYLGSRYYVPQFCRFFNADKHSDTQTGVLSTNMFAYCNNNPVMNIDPTGEAAKSLDIFALIINFVKRLVRNINAKAISKKGLEMAPLSDHIKTMKNKNMTYSYSYKFDLYQVNTIYYTQTWYSNEEYTISTVSTSVENWYSIIDEIEFYLNIYGIFGLIETIVGKGITVTEAAGLIEATGYTLPAFASTLSAIAAYLSIPVSLIMYSVDRSADGIGNMLEGKLYTETLTFNLKVTRNYWVMGMNETNEEVLHTVIEEWLIL